MRIKEANLITVGILVAVASGVIGFGSYSKSESVKPGDFSTHQNREILFRYPANWFVNDFPEDVNSFVLTTVANYDLDVLITTPHPSGNYYKIEIVKLPNQDRLSLTSWVDQFIKNSPTGPVVVYQKFLTIDGLEAIYNLEQAWGVIHPAIYISRGDFIYIINSAPVISEFESVFDEIINSFKFIDSS